MKKIMPVCFLPARNFSLILLFLTSFFTVSVASKDTLSVRRDSVNNDSINTAILNEYRQKLAQIENLRIEDSTKRVQLEEKLNSLKTTDNLKKESLLQQIEELNTKEARRIKEKKEQIDSLKLTAKGYPVLGFFNDTLFLIFNRLGSFSPGERAEAITSKIKTLASNIIFVEDSLLVSRAENSAEIVYGENIIMSITENDALWNNTDKATLAQNYRDTIAGAIKEYNNETSVMTLAKEIGLAAAVIVLVGVLIFYITKLFRWTSKKIIFQKDKSIKGIKIKGYTLLDAKSQVNFLLNVNTVGKWLMILLVVYIALPILFGIFPWTEHLATTLFGYILNPIKKIAVSLWNYIPNFITITVIIIVFRYVLKLLHYFKKEIENGNLKISGFYPDWATPTYQIIKVLVYAFMIVVLFPYLPGSDSPVFQGVTVFLGFLFTFGSTGSLSNIVAGLVLTYMRVFIIGDRVKIGEITGDVIEKSLLVTRIRTIKNEIISIPNSTVMSSHTVNYSSDAPANGLIIHTTVTIGYDVPWRTMHQTLIDAALRTELILKEPQPFVLQTSLDDFYVSYQINAYVREANKQAVIYSDLHRHIQDVCNENGIEIMSPHYRAGRDGNRSTIPADYLPKDYTAPAFIFENRNREEKNIL